MERVPAQAVNRKTFEALALSGSFDCFTEMKREDYMEKNIRDESFAEVLLRYGQQYQQSKMQSEASLFGDDPSLDCAGRPSFKPAVEWLPAVKLEKERELVGMYLSAHPLDPYYMELRYGCTSIKDFNERQPEENQTYYIGGMVTDFKSGNTKRGDKYGIIKIEDLSGSMEIRLFGQDYYKFANYGEPGTSLIITGSYTRRFANSDLRFTIGTIDLLTNVQGKLIKGVNISIPANMPHTQVELLKSIQEMKGEKNGTLSLTIVDHNIGRSVKMNSSARIPLTKNLATLLDDMEVDYIFET